MHLEIKRYKNHQLTSTETSMGFPFEAVKQDAAIWIEQNLADRIEVYDVNQKLIFQPPRVVRAGIN